MNLRAVLWLLGRVLLVLAAFQLVPVLVAAYARDMASALAFVSSAAISASLGGLLCFRNRLATLNSEGRPDFFRREGLAAVGLTWMALPVLGGLPYLLSGYIASPVDAIFETSSGFTTTGGSILRPDEIDALPLALGFYRNFTNWLGGIGIVLVFVLLFPTGGRSLYRSEVAGISREATTSRVRDSVLVLVKIYLIITAAIALALVLAGLSAYEALVHSFATIATGGFSPHGASVAYFDSWLVEFIIVLGMYFSGMNFGWFEPFLRGRWRQGLSNMYASTELRLYTGLCIGLVGIITLSLWFWGGSNGAGGAEVAPELAALPDYSSIKQALRDSAFSVVTVQTSTGYVTADFDRWPEFCRLALMFVALVGGCAGSTSGGLKVIRFAIVLKAASLVVIRFARPRAVQGVRLDGHVLDEALVASTTAYFGLFILVLGISGLLLTALGMELVPALSGAVACLCNMGPGLGPVGPAGSFADVPTLGKLIYSVLMVLGRLEFYAVLVLFVPRFWRY
jgi:trk system potassium uptake protein